MSIFPFDEVALAIAGLNGPDSVNNPQLSTYLSLLRLMAMVRQSAERGAAPAWHPALLTPSRPLPPPPLQLRMYRLYFYFSFLTYNLGTPLLLVTLLKNLSVRALPAAGCAPRPPNPSLMLPARPPAPTPPLRRSSPFTSQTSRPAPSTSWLSRRASPAAPG